MDMETTREILEDVSRARGKAFGEARKMTMVQLQNAYIEMSSKLKAYELIAKQKIPVIKDEDAQDDDAPKTTKKKSVVSRIKKKIQKKK